MNVAVRLTRAPSLDTAAVSNVRSLSLSPEVLEVTAMETLALPDEPITTEPVSRPTSTGAVRPVGLSSPMALPKFSVNQTVPLFPVVR